MQLTQQQISAITNAISPVRLGTYANATGFSAGVTPLQIYIWNAQVSGAFIPSLQICEVAIRNGIANAILRQFGAQWPWDPGFERTLPTNRKVNLQEARANIPFGATGKVIAELKFIFWCSMFTQRYDVHLWNRHLRTEFPGLPPQLTVANARAMLHQDMEKLRLLRNRIAHHEPIFHHPLADHQQRIARLIGYRCDETQRWHAQWQTLTMVLAAKP